MVIALVSKIFIMIFIYFISLAFCFPEYYFLEDPIISDVKRRKHGYVFSIGYIEDFEFESSQNKILSFNQRIIYNSSAKLIKCEILKSKSVQCFLGNVWIFDENKTKIISGVYDISKKNEKIIVGKHEGYLNIKIKYLTLKHKFNDLMQNFISAKRNYDEKLSEYKKLWEKNTLDLIKMSNKMALNNLNNDKLSIGFLYFKFRDSGIERFIANLANNLMKTNLYDIYILSDKPNVDDFDVDLKIKRIDVYDKGVLNKERMLLFLKSYKIDILIQNAYSNLDEINFIIEAGHYLNIKVVMVMHSFFMHLNMMHKINKLYQYATVNRKADCLIYIVPNEDYFWKRLNITSYYIPNIPQYNYNDVNSSSLKYPNLLLVGRGQAIKKHFDVGIKAMKYIIKEIPDAKLQILSGGNLTKLKALVKQLGLENNVDFVGYTKTPEVYYRNASIHLFPSEYEGFGYALYEAKAHGLANIVSGKTYLSLNKKGTIIVPHNNPEVMAEEAIKLLKDYKYRINLGKEAKESLKELTIDNIIAMWNKFFAFL